MRARTSAADRRRPDQSKLTTTFPPAPAAAVDSTACSTVLNGTVWSAATDDFVSPALAHGVDDDMVSYADIRQISAHFDHLAGRFVPEWHGSNTRR
jgi:hypothetical protein